VVAATHLELDQPVALKFMLPAAMESPEASARFMREARAAGKLTSEHVFRVSDVGRFESGAPYIVMEYLEGYDLGTMLRKRGPLRLASAIDYVLQACEGLAEAHAQGIVHRDLKPDNLYLSARADGGRIIKVLDFGISKAAVTGIATQTGDILGSPAYMAPEQMRSTKDVDARADIWSLGVVLYQLVTGRLPFAGDSLPNLCLAVLNDEPVPPGQIREDVPDGLSDVILHCLEKERDDRYSDVGELAAALAEFATPGGFGSVTRVRAALRGRPAPPDPSQTVPHGFEAQTSVPVVSTVAPTLAGTIGPTMAGTDERFVPRPTPPPPQPGSGPAPTVQAKLKPSGPQSVGVSTLAGSSGESIEKSSSPRFPLGLIGALSGAIGLVVVLIVMVLRSGGGDDAGTDPAEPPKAVAGPGKSGEAQPPPADPKAAPKVEPIIEPIVEPVTDPATDPGAGSSAGAGSGTSAKDPKSDGGTRPPRVRVGGPGPGAGAGSGKDRAKDPTKDAVKDPKDPKAGSNAAPPDNTTPTPDAGVSEEDKWGRMTHDKPKGQGS
jgi:serine/threonine-protein kinase